MPEFRTIDIGDRAPVNRVVELGDAELGWVEIDKLMIDDTYQRALGKTNWTQILKIANNFAWSRFSPVLLAPVSGGYFAVIDGQHRVHAARMVGIDQVPAMIVPMTPVEQASAFSWVNGQVTGVTQHQILKAALAAGEQWALESRMVVETAGCRLMTYNASRRSKKPRQVYVVSTIKNLVNLKRGDLVVRGLSAIADLSSECGELPESYTTAILEPWFAALQTDAIFDRLDLVEFCRQHHLVNVREKSVLLRSRKEYADVSFKELTRRSFVALLHQFAKQGEADPAVTKAQPAPASEAELGDAMARAARTDRRARRGTIAL